MATADEEKYSKWLMIAWWVLLLLLIALIIASIIYSLTHVPYSEDFVFESVGTFDKVKITMFTKGHVINKSDVVAKLGSTNDESIDNLYKEYGCVSVQFNESSSGGALITRSKGYVVPLRHN